MRTNPHAKPRHISGPASLPAAVVVSAALLLTGCGSSRTETVSVSSTAAPSSQATQTNPATPRKTSTSQAAAPSGARPATGATTGRSGSAPAFVQPKTADEGPQAALATVKAHGYTADEPSQYRTGQTLTVLVGTRAGSRDGYDQQAFFFVDGRYIGTDTSAPSAAVKLLSQSDTEVTLAYPLYRSHDPLCCPGGGQARVRFQLNNGKLVALDPIPPVSSTTGLSRQ